ncbi:MAG TPA: asparagine synthase (glutamine-hydrolyzing) [Verrucomicrobiota bacterium]|nr:asparagine synthase (glutamine-hydrolyzing) [Verrucomicrobiota bacterium]HNU52025.1 asparagine synthase (glutamine-hydrolyzing) [Verrucomicrobiota bacterium]
MCGICGIWHFDPARPVDRDVLWAMTRTLVHRGPDEEGIHLEGPIGLGFRRLSIIDLAGSHQPMANEPQSVWIVFNGEIYNFQTLRAILGDRYRFRTTGDTETLLHAYEESGIACVHQLRGMFAFAVWDRDRQSVALAVDRFGKKPLYYALDREKLVFGSELKSVLECPEVDRTLDDEALDEYLAAGYIAAPRSIYRSIRKLPPGHTLVVDARGQAQLREYWHPRWATTPSSDGRPPADLAAELRQRLEDAVRLRMISDVPLGAFLSGGVDSSVVVALMSRLSPQPVRTFSIGFDEAGYDESQYAQLVADHCRTEHVHEVVRPDIVGILPKLVRQYDEPFADNSMIPTYYVSAMARQHVTVALSGDGGDEIFAGYQWYRRAYRHALLHRFVPAPLRPLVARLAPWIPSAARIGPFLEVIDRPIQHWAMPAEYFPTPLRHALYRPEQRQRVSPYDADAGRREILDSVAAHHWLGQLQYSDWRTYLPGDILVKVDRASMLASLEVRSPLLDHVVFEFMAGIPADLRLNGRESKVLLKHAVRDLLPPVILGRRKRGFDLPMGQWLCGPLRPMLEDLLLGPDARVAAFCEPAAMRRLVAAHVDGRARHDGRLWALLCLELWARDGRPQP